MSVNQKRIDEKLNVGKQNLSLDSRIRPPLCFLLWDSEQVPQPLCVSSLTSEMAMKVVPPPLGSLLYKKASQMTACSNKTAALGIETRIELLRELLSAHSMVGALLGSEKNNKKKTKKTNKKKHCQC